MRLSRAKQAKSGKWGKDATLASGAITAMEGGSGGLVLAIVADGVSHRVHLRCIELMQIKPAFDRAYNSVGEAVATPPAEANRSFNPRMPYKD